MTAFARAVVLAVALCALGACKTRTPTIARNWPTDRPAADSVARAMAAVVGAAPGLLASCGPHHVLIAYLDAPVDLRPEHRRGTNGEVIPIISIAQRSRHAVAAVIAIAFWSAMPLNTYDTTTVRLSRVAHFPSGFSDRNEYTLAPVVEGIHLSAQPVAGRAEACAQVI